MVSPNLIGGVRLVSEMLRPQTVAFLDRLLRVQEEPTIRIEEVDVPKSSGLVGLTLSDASIREAGALVVAIHQPSGEYVYNPNADMKIEAGSSLIVLANMADVDRLRRTANEGVS